MRRYLASRIMPRTTIDLDPHVLRELKRRKRPGQSLGQLASELLSGALADEVRPAPSHFHWRSARMEARVDLEDKEAVRRAVDEK
jgi:hypothetical protein